MRESAVVAYVPAELRERDENFPGIRNQVSMPGVAQTRSHRQQRLEVLLFRERHHVQVLGQLAVECHLKNRLRHLPHSENSLSNRLRFATHLQADIVGNEVRRVQLEVGVNSRCRELLKS